MKHVFPYFLLSLCWLSPLLGQAQVSVVPASSSCTCDGAFSFAPYPGEFTFFQVIDHTGVELVNTSSTIGELDMTGLCGDVFIVQAQSSLGSTSELIQVPAIGASVGTANEANICSTNNPINLSTFLSAYTLGGTWYRPNGTTFNGSYNPAIETGGLYYYSYSFGGCPVFTGVLVSEIQNGNAGLQTTYLICDTYDEFFMTDFLEGNPDYTGYWTTTSGVLVDGYYDPATMDSELFVYVIDNIPGCNPVYNTLFVDENSTPNPGIATTIAICDNAQPFNIFDQIPGNPDSGGFWFSPLNTPTDIIFDPSTDILGTYRYVVPATSPCQQQEVQIIIEFTNDDPSGISTAIDVCSSQEPFDMTDLLLGNPSFGGQWTDEQGNIISEVYDPSSQSSGLFNYYVPNVGCSALGSELIISEYQQPSAGTDIVAELCQSSTPIDLTSFLNNAEMGGTFETQSGSSVTSSWDVSFTQLIQLLYIVDSPFCPKDTSELIIGVVGQPTIPNNLSLDYCSNDPLIDLNEFYPSVALPLWSHTNSSIGTYDPANGSTLLQLTSLSNNVCPNYQAEITIHVSQPYFEDVNLMYNVCNAASPFDLNDFIDAADIPNGEWWTSSMLPTPSVVPQNEPGTYTYLFISNINGACAATTQALQLIVSDSIHAGPDDILLLCANMPPVELVGFLASGIDINGQWLFQDQAVGSSFIDPSTFASGEYLYVLPPNIGCPGDTAQFQLTIQQPTLAEAGENIILCENSTPIVLGGSNVPGATYSWSPSFNISASNIANPEVTLSSSGNQTAEYEYFVTLENGVCSTIDSITITVHPLPSINLNPEISTCIGSPITLSVSEDFDVSWAPQNLFAVPTLHQQTLAPSSNTVVYVDAINSYGCSATDSIQVIVHPLPVLNYAWQFEESCAPFTLQLSPFFENEDVYSGSWFLNDQFISSQENLTYPITEEGWYDLSFVAESEFGCTSTWNFEDGVLVHPVPQALFDWSPTLPSILLPQVNFENLSIGAEDYTWQFEEFGSSNAVSPSIEFTTDEASAVDVCLTATNLFGCSDTLCQQLSIVSEHVLFAPNAFTPNGDGLNDVFSISLNGFEEVSYELIIFDRWGVELFKTQNPNEPWIGDVRGGENFAADGVYTWQVKVKVDLIADYLIYTGHLTLIR